jgi:hypothetical protein
MATRGRFYLIEIMLERGILSDTLTRYVTELTRKACRPANFST